MARSTTLDELRRYAIARSLFKPVSLPAAIRRLGFVQADPIRAPARAQDLILFQRVRGYRAGDLERRYERLGIEEDAFVNYGFVPREMLALLHPRTPRRPWDAATMRRAQEVLAFVQARGVVHPREVGEAFAHHGRIAGYWGGELNASTRLLEHMHHHGWLRVRRREAGTRVYEAMIHAEQDDSPAAPDAPESRPAVVETDNCTMDKLADRPGLQFVQECVKESKTSEQWLTVIEEAKKAEQCDVAQRLYVNKAQSGDVKIAMAYAREYDPKDHQANACFSKPNPATAAYWYETVLLSEPDNAQAKARFQELSQ